MMRISKMAAALVLALGFGGLSSDAEGFTAYGISRGGLAKLGPAYPMLTNPPIAVAGLQGGEAMLAIDYHALNSQLYVVTNQNRLYLLNPDTGVLTQVGSEPFADPATLGLVAFDIISGTNEARIITSSTNNLRLNLTTGEIVMQDSPLVFADGDPHEGELPGVRAATYAPDNTLYGLDESRNKLVRVGGPAGSPAAGTGVVSTVAPLGQEWVDHENALPEFIASDTLDGMDAGPNGIIYVGKLSTFYNPRWATFYLYSVNVETGELTQVHLHDMQNMQIQSFTVVPDGADEDGDGITDSLDQCPGTPAGTMVTPSGCPVDTADSDGDGVPNYLDFCAGTPPNTIVYSNGCPRFRADVAGVQVSNSQKCNKKGACKRQVEVRVLKTLSVDNKFVTVGVYESVDEIIGAGDVRLLSKKVKFHKKTDIGKFKFNAKMTNGNANVLVVVDDGDFDVKDEEDNANNLVVVPRP